MASFEAFNKMLDGVLKLEEDTAKDLSSDWVEKLVQRKPTLFVPRHRRTSEHSKID